MTKVNLKTLPEVMGALLKIIMNCPIYQGFEDS